MARNSLSDFFISLNLSRRQIGQFRELLIIGSQMAQAIQDLENVFGVKEELVELSTQWSGLVVEITVPKESAR